MIAEVKPKFSVTPVSSVFPLSRTKLVEEILTSKGFREIDDIYLSRGHIFVLLDGRKKLVTFDTKSVDHIQEVETKGCLDIETEIPIVAVIGLPSNAVYIIQQNGVLQQWQYRPDSSWKFVSEQNILTSQGACVTDVCLNVAQNSLYWCEGSQTEGGGRPMYCICKRQMSEDEDKQRFRRNGASKILVNNCPRSKVYPIGHGVLVVTEAVPPAMSVGLLLSTLTGRIEVIVGGECMVSNLTVHSEVDFKQILMSCISLISKARGAPAVICSCYCHTTQSLIQITADGHINRVNSESATHHMCVHLENFQPEGILGCTELFRNIGIVYETEIRIYNLLTGKCVGVVASPDESHIQGTCHTLLGGHLSAFFTTTDMFIIQRSRNPVSQNDEELLGGCNFQSDAVRLAFIDKLKTSATETSPLSSVEKMRENWQQMTGKLPNSRLMETVEPFLKEYWSLESLLQNSLDKPECIPQIQELSARDMVAHLLDPASHISRSSRQSQLLLLSHTHPGDVLEGLLSNLDLGSDELSTSQQQKWQCIMTGESSDVAMSCDIAVPLFEQITYLLFKHRPDKLMVFLRRGQQVCDLKVGVSAFIRKRQTLQVYERALRCLPEPMYSVDQDAAVYVTVHLLLTSEVDGSTLKAVRLLLRYKKYQEAIDLLQQQTDTNTKTYNILYQLILTTVTQNGVLPQYSSDIFSLMPSLESCQQLSATALEQTDQDVFCSDSNGVSVDQARPHLLKYIKDNDS